MAISTTINKILNVFLATLLSFSIFFYINIEKNLQAGTMGYENAGGKVDETTICTCLYDPCFPQVAFSSGEPRGGDYIDSLTCTLLHYQRGPVTIGYTGWHLSKTTEEKPCLNQDGYYCEENDDISSGRLLLFGGTSGMGGGGFSFGF